MRKLIVLAGLVLMGGLGMQAQGYGPPPNGQYGGPPPPPQGGNNTLRINQSLMRGQALFSNNGQFKLEFQGDGNVVLTRRDGRILWDTGTAGARAYRLTMQDDGNVVLYDRHSRPIWNTGITGPNMRHGQVFVLQDDGNLVVYSRGQVYWASQTERRGRYGR